VGSTSTGGGLANLASSLPIPPQGQIVADYIVEGGANSGNFSAGRQQNGGVNSSEH
jgi:hypothetical protein